jgi:hypothetical protein
LTNFGSDVYQPKQPINITYDAFGVPAAFLRGLFEYLYRADGVTIAPHIPPAIAELQQLDPVRFGNKKLYLSTVGHGPVTSVEVNGRPWRSFDSDSVFLAYNDTPNLAHIVIGLGGSTGRPRVPAQTALREEGLPSVPGNPERPQLASLDAAAAKARVFRARLVAAGFGESYEAAHAQLILDAVSAARVHEGLRAAGKLPPLPEASQAAADKSYEDTVMRLSEGLAAVMKSYEKSSDARARNIYRLYAEDE